LRPMLHRGLQQYPFETSSLPYLPDWTAAISAARLVLLRCWVPCWTIRLYFWAASMHRRPSATRWLIGFSTYTSLPAWQAQTVASACQWLGVATETASRFLSARASRRSATHFGATPYFSLIGCERDSHRLLSGSIR